MTTTDFTGKTKAELVELLDYTVKRLREKLADTLAEHDVHERKYGFGTQDRAEGHAGALRHSLFMLGAGDWDEIDAVAESMWPAAMANLANILDGAAKGATDPARFASLCRSRDIARQLLAEHEAAKGRAA